MIVLAVFIPDLDDPLRGAGDEDVGDEGVPLYVVDRGVVGRESVEEPGAVLGRTQVHHTCHSDSDDDNDNDNDNDNQSNLHQFPLGRCCHRPA